MMEAKVDFEARDYQNVLAQQAIESNRILFLPTGSGKTFISIMVLKHVFHQLEKPFDDGGKRAVFLVNTVALVEQQANVLKRHVQVEEVGRYSGDMNLDNWTKDIWLEQFRAYEVMVMTAEIMLQLLLKKYISLPQLALMILDECHHAVEDHPMRQLMKLLEDCPLDKQPRVVGLTATLLNSTPKSLLKVVEEVKKLEVTLHSTIATVNSWELVKKFSTKPKETIVPFLSQLLTDYDVDGIVEHMKKLCECHELDADEYQGTILKPGFSPLRMKKKKYLKNLVSQVTKQYASLGKYGCMKTALAVYVTLQSLMLKAEDTQTKLVYMSLLSSLMKIRKILDLKMSAYPIETDRAIHYITPKVSKLLSLLRNHHENCEQRINGQTDPMRVIVFVQERMTAKILCSILKNVARREDYKFMRTEFIVGQVFDTLNESWEAAFVKHNNTQVVKRFRDGMVNIIVCSDVLEEGIDVTLCNMVLKFDKLDSFRSYIQSKGRARHTNSLFVLLSEAPAVIDLQKKLDFYNSIERKLVELLVGKTSERESPTEDELNDLYDSELPPYETPAGAKITMTSAISLLNGYLMSLSRDRFSQADPIWGIKRIGLYQVVCVQLPKVSPFQEAVESPIMGTVKSAKRAAALEMCKRLHQAGEINDYLLPNEVALSAEDTAYLFPLWEEEARQSKTGTKNQTRTYPIYKPKCFSIGGVKGKFYIHTIEMTPVGSASADNVSRLMHSLMGSQSFAIISSSEIPEVGCFPVFSKFGEIRVDVRVKCTCSLTDEQLKEIEQYHIRLFTVIIPIAKTFLYFKRSGNNQHFLIIPVERDGSNIAIDWKTMWSSLDDGPIKSPEKSLGYVINPIHRQANYDEVYIVCKVSETMTALSKFPDPVYSNFADYFEKKYNFKIQNPNLPLLEVCPMSLKSDAMLPRKPAGVFGDHYVLHFPPEMCVKKAVEGSLCLQAVLLPSILHRLERLLIANDLRHMIAREAHIGVVNLPFGQTWNSLQWSGDPKTFDKEIKMSHVERLNISWKNHQSKKQKREACHSALEDNYNSIDIEREFEHITSEDLQRFKLFTDKKMSIISSPYRAANKPVVCSQQPMEDGKGLIKLLTADSGCGPHPCHIYEAITASSSNDIVDYERFETLGDSFLKFAVSLYLFMRFPNMSEGNCTTVKGKLLGNRNLFYCARNKGLGNYLKVKKMVVSESFNPPHFSVPHEILDSISDAPGRAQHLYRLILSPKERINGILHPETLIGFNNCNSDMVAGDLSYHFGMQTINDKCVADAVESLLGCYLQVCGPQAAFELLKWFKILPEYVTDSISTGEILRCSPQKIKKPEFIDSPTLIQKALGYTFNDRSLLLEAVTHSSFPGHQKSYERLEFIGDAVLDFLITSYIFEHCGKLGPGDLTDLRSALVNNITFACLTVRNGFQKFLLNASPALFICIDQFVAFQESRRHLIDDEVLILLEEDECKLAETVDVPKALGDLFEALVGAVFVDSGKNLATVWKVVFNLMKNEISKFSKNVPKQVVRRLYEIVPHGVQFRISKEKSLTTQTMVELLLTINGETRRYNGFGDNKAQAKKSAAKLALKDLQF